MRSSLSKLGVLTRNRPQAVLRCLDSFLANAAAHGRNLECSVIDTSDASDDGTREALQSLAQRRSARIGYADHPGKRRFVDRLARESAVPRELIEFALGDPHRCGHDAGANRNALLLAHAGQPFLSADDDVVCDLRRPVDSKCCLSLSDRSDATAVTLFPDSPSAFAAHPIADHCVLDLHERLLGRAVSECGSDDVLQPVLERELTPTAQQALQAPGARVAVTMTGILGDSGASYPAFYLWRDQSMRQQLQQVPEHLYRRLTTSRQLARFVPTPTVSTGVFFMTTSCAFDARGTLPPFFPVMRGQDLNFGVLMRACFQRAFIGFLPEMIAHLPWEARQANELFSRSSRPYFHQIVRHSLQLPPTEGSDTDGEQRLKRMGSALLELAALPGPEFEELLRSRLRRGFAARVRGLQRQLAQGADAPPHWRRDLSHFLEHRLQVLRTRPRLTPIDLGRTLPDDEAWALGQRMLHHFGALLIAWPTLYRAAISLGRREQGLTRPV